MISPVEVKKTANRNFVPYFALSQLLTRTDLGCTTNSIWIKNLGNASLYTRRLLCTKMYSCEDGTVTPKEEQSHPSLFNYFYDIIFKMK